MSVKISIGSARHDENGKYIGGEAGDQLQKSSTNDTTGEVSMCAFYVHTLGWNVFRPKDASHAGVIACKMISACNNKHIGYDQGNRLGIISKGIDTKTDTEGDCSSIVRECIKEATGTDPGNFTTADEAEKLKATGLFEESFAYVSQEKTPIYNGDVLVTKKKGHTAIVVSGNPRVSGANDAGGKSYYAKYAGSSSSIVDALAAVGEKDTSKAHRKKIATANGIANYSGTSAQNTKLLSLLKKGKLIKA